MEKVTLEELTEKAQNGEWTEAVIVFTPHGFKKEYKDDIIARSYTVYSNAKWFNPAMLGNSLFGNCLDGLDNGVRLDYYFRTGEWIIDYCYITKSKEKKEG